MTDNAAYTNYRCSQCGETYSSAEYNSLGRKLLHPENEDPERRGGYENVCRKCGSGFHSEKWVLRDRIENDDGKFTVSTVALTIAHGPNRDQWFETLIYHPWGNRITDRYSTQEDAENGHERRVEQIKNDEYHREPSAWSLVMEDDDE